MLRRLMMSSLLLVSSLAFGRISDFKYDFVCTAKDLFTGNTFTEGAFNEQVARYTAMERCRSETGHVCVARCVEKGISSDYGSLLYSCLTTDKTARTWVEVGPTLNYARDASLAACFQDGGVSCQTMSCSVVHD